MPYFNWNGYQLFYREQGDGPLLLILPGNTASSVCHQAELEYFSDRYRVVSLDFLGTGQSDRVAVWSEAWYEQAADQAQTLVERLEVKDCIAMGTSGGAAIALLLAIMFPHRVRAVIADSCIEKFSAEMLQQNVIEERGQRKPEQVGFWEFAHGPDWEQVIEADTAMLRRLTKKGGNWFSGRLSAIQCPVLLTASLQDEHLPQVAQQVCGMAGQITDCRVFLHNEGGHPLVWSRPQVFRYQSDYFLKTIDE